MTHGGYAASKVGSTAGTSPTSTRRRARYGGLFTFIGATQAGLELADHGMAATSATAQRKFAEGLPSGLEKRGLSMFCGTASSTLASTTQLAYFKPA